MPSRAGGTTGAQLMKETVGARPLALGSSYASISRDPYALVYNPAGLGTVARFGLETDFGVRLGDAKVGSLLLAGPAGRWGGFGVGVLRQELGRIELFNNDGTVSSRRGQDDLLVMAGYGYATTPSWGGPGRFAAGVAGKHFTSTLLEQSRASADAVDVGVLWETPWYATLAASVSNIGPGVGYTGGGATGEKDPLPRTVRVGASARAVTRSGRDSWLGTVEVRRTVDETTKVGLGAEFIVGRLAALRFGYVIGEQLGAFSAGVGILLKRFEVSYGMGATSAVNYKHSVSLGFRFGAGAERTSYADLRRRHRAEQAEMPAGLFKRGLYFKASEVIAEEPLLPEAEETERKIKSWVQEALDAGPTVNPRAYYYALAHRARFGEENWTKIVASLEFAANWDPGNPELTEQLVAARQEAAEQAAKLAARSTELYLGAVKRYQKKNYDAAIVVLREALRLNPANADAMKLLDLSIQGSIAQERKRSPAPAPAAAAASAPIRKEQLADYDPVKAEQLYKDGLMAYVQKDYASALKLLAEALEKNPGNERINNALERVKREVKK